MRFEDITKGQKVVVLNHYRVWGECEVVDTSPPQTIIVQDARFKKNHFVNAGQIRLSKGRPCGVWITTDYKTVPPTINVLLRYPSIQHLVFEPQIRGIESLIGKDVEIPGENVKGLEQQKQAILEDVSLLNSDQEKARRKLEGK